MCHLLVASAMEKEDAGSADPVGEGECAISVTGWVLDCECAISVTGWVVNCECAVSAIIGEFECAASLFCNCSHPSSLCINMLSYIY